MRTRGRASRSNAETAEIAEKVRRYALCGLCVLFVSTAACGTGLFRQYEYEEDVYLSLDGSATVYVNSSLAALNALRGTSFDPRARVDADAVRAYYSSPVTRAGRVKEWRRSNRRFMQVRLDTDDIRTLSAAPPFAWSKYQFKRDGNLYLYLQTVGGAAGKDVGNVGWTGRELVAFRLHLPSKIRYHNTHGEAKGNILVWEQPLTDRLRGVPLTLDARMDPQSILYRTLWLFGITFVAVAAAFGVIIWWVVRRSGENNVEGRTGR
jgi:hypothetical protein